MISFRTGQAEKSLFEDRVTAIPNGQGKTEPALAVGDAEKSILAPTVSAAAGVLVREMVPGLAVWRVILAHDRPLALAEIRRPAFPALLSGGVLAHTPGFHTIGLSVRHGSLRSGE